MKKIRFYHFPKIIWFEIDGEKFCTIRIWKNISYLYLYNYPVVKRSHFFIMNPVKYDSAAKINFFETEKEALNCLQDHLKLENKSYKLGRSLTKKDIYTK